MDQERKGRGRVRRWALRVLLFVVVPLAVLVLAAPTIAGWIAPGRIESVAGGAVNGTVEVKGTSFSWFGDQRVGPVVITDAQGQKVGQVEVRVRRGLWSLASGALGGGPDVGEVHITGDATVVLNADGTTNLQKLIKPAPAGGGGSGGARGQARVPKGLAAKIVVDSLDVTVVNARHEMRSLVLPHETFRLNTTGNASFAVGGPAEVHLVADVESDNAQGAMTPAGKLTVDAKVDSLTDASGLVTIEAAKVAASVEAKGLVVGIADAFAKMDSRLEQAIGRTLDASVKVNGSIADATVDATANSSGLAADLGLRYADGVLTTSKTGRVALASGSALQLVPGFSEALETQDAVEFATLPGVDVTIESLRFPVKAGADLRGAGAKLALKTGEMTGTVKVPGEERARPFRVRPLSASVDAPDLAGPVRVRADTAATIEDQPAGGLVVDISASGLLDDKGAVRPGGPGAVAGAVIVNGLRTAIAEPFVKSTGVDLQSDIGPELDIELRAKTMGSGGEGGGVAALPRTAITLEVNSANVKADADLVVERGVVRGGPKAVTARVGTVGPLVSRVLEKAGVKVASGGSVAVDVSDLSVDLAAAGDLRKVGGTVDVAVGAAKGTALLAEGKPSVWELAPATVHLDARDLAKSLVLSAKASARVDGKPAGDIDVGVTASGLLDAQGRAGTPRDVDASVMVKGIATAIAQPWVEKLGLKLAEDVGESVDVALTATSSPAGGDGKADAIDVRATVDSTKLSAKLAGGLGQGFVDIGRAEATWSLTPALSERMLAKYAPTAKGRLTGPATVAISTAPMRIPLGPGFKPEAARMPDAVVTARIDGRTVLDGLTLVNADGTQRALGPVGMEKAVLNARVPLSAVMGPTAKRAQVTLTAGLLSGGEKLAGLSLDAGGNLSSGAPTGPLSADVKLAAVNTKGVDAIIGKPGLVSGAVGQVAAVDAAVTMVMAAPGSTQPSGEFPVLDIKANVTSPKLKTSQPLTATVLPDRARLSGPLVVNWQMDPAWADRWVLAAAEGTAPTVRFAKPTQLTLQVSKLDAGMGVNGPLKPGIFAMDAEVSAPAVDMVGADGAAAEFGALRARVRSAEEAGVVGYSLRLGEEQRGDAEAVEFRGSVRGIADAQGNPTPDAARLTVRGGTQKFPTAVVDALARQKGTLNEALGPTITLKVTADDFSAQGGSLSATANSPRANAAVKGMIRSGQFVADGPVRVTLTEITPALGKKLTSGLPLIGTLEKKPGDGPAVLTATGLTAPVDGDLSKLNGTVVLDLGQARFETSGRFAKVLKFADQRQAGMIGRRLEPLTLRMDKGVISYERYRLPLGEFSVESVGEKIDLVKRELDVVTYVPAGKVVDEVIGKFSGGLGGVLGGVIPQIEQATMIPLRTKGSFDDVGAPVPDVELFVKNLAGQPGNLIENILKGIGGGKDKDKK